MLECVRTGLGNRFFLGRAFGTCREVIRYLLCSRMSTRLSGKWIWQALVLACAFMCLSEPVHGSPFLERLQISSPESPFSTRSANRGLTAAYFHPARVPLDRLRVSSAVVSLYQSHTLTFKQRPAGFDISGSVYRSRSVSMESDLGRIKPIATGELPYQARRADRQAHRAETLVLGLSTPVIVDTLGIAMVATLPVGLLQTQRPFFPDERSQFFDGRLYPELYRDRLESSTVALSANCRIAEWLSFGMGIALSNHSRSVPQVYIPDAGDQERTLTNAQIEVTPTLAPFGSVNVKPFLNNPVSLSLTVHSPSESRLTGRGQLRFWEFEYPEGQNFLKQTFDLIFQSQPLRLGVGLDADFRLGSGGLSLYADGVWSRWSTYKNRHGERGIDWSNTVDLKAGLTYQIESNRFGLGAAYFPTPVPSQAGRTNYVDSSRVAGQIGWLRDVSVGENQLSFGIGLQFQRLIERRHSKSPDARNPILDEFPESRDLRTGELNQDSVGTQTNNPGFPGYSHAGYLVTTMVNVGLEL